jgi:spermidine synthase
LLTNGKFQGNNAGEMVDQASFALVPVALTPGRSRAFVIGLGTGQSANAIAHAGFERVEIAEIAKGMIQAAPLFAAANEDVLNRPNVSVHVGDGRNILLRSREKYDLVSMEISSLWFSGSVSLYSEEFYDLVEKRLAPNGVLQQWIQLHHMGTDELVSALVTARSVFSNVSLWVVGSQGVLIASNDELHFEPERLATPELQRIMSLLTAHELSALEISKSRVLNPADITRMAEYAKSAGIPKNTDANRWLEYWSPRYNLVPRNWMVVNLKWFYDFSTEPESKKALLETKKRLFDRQP